MIIDKRSIGLLEKLLPLCSG